jgi:hypothetical protein
MAGAIQIELVSRILVPSPDGSISIEWLATGRLRCSPAAAAQLRDGLIGALKLLRGVAAGRHSGIQA